MKICRKCNQDKSLECFGKHKGRKDGLQSYCKECALETSKKWYKDNKDDPEIAKRISEYNKSLVDSLKKEVDDCKESKGCCVCGETDPCALDFHHPDAKDVGVSYLRRAKSRDRLYQEMAKCVVLCSNCHRKLHAGRFTLK